MNINLSNDALYRYRSILKTIRMDDEASEESSPQKEEPAIPVQNNAAPGDVLNFISHNYYNPNLVLTSGANESPVSLSGNIINPFLPTNNPVPDITDMRLPQNFTDTESLFKYLKLDKNTPITADFLTSFLNQGSCLSSSNNCLNSLITNLKFIDSDKDQQLSFDEIKTLMTNKTDGTESLGAFNKNLDDIKTEFYKQPNAENSEIKEFYDATSMFEYLKTKTNGAVTKSSGLNYKETFKLAQDEQWNEKNQNFFQEICRNFNELDTDKNGVLSESEMKAVIGSAINRGLNNDNNFFKNIKKIDEEKTSKYNALNPEAKLSKIINEARKYLELIGDKALLNKLNSYDIRSSSLKKMGAIGFTNPFSQTISLENDDVKTKDLYTMAGVLLHELIHAKDGDLGSSIAEENWCEQLDEDYRDTMGKSRYLQKNEAAEINIQNQKDYSNLPQNGYVNLQDKTLVGKFLSEVWHGVTTIIANIGSLFKSLFNRERSHTVSGNNQNVVLEDTKRCERYNIYGSNNTVVVKGDKKANTFNIGGENNKIVINRIGSDDSVQLQGDPKDWQVMDQGSKSKELDCDGYVVMYNTRTGTTVILGTDGGRSADFIKSKISYV